MAVRMIVDCYSDNQEGDKTAMMVLDYTSDYLWD
jgi:hypothetical protein